MTAVRAMILAAGRGERMRPLTDTLPKPLLPVAGKPLIEYPVQALAAAGVQDVVINLSYRGAQIREYLGDGARYGLRLAYSEEGEPPLETGGGIFKALPMLGEGPFVVVNADVFSHYPIAKLVQRARSLPPWPLGHLVLVPNPAHNPKGDFATDGERAVNDGARMTFSGLSIQRPQMFARCAAGRFPMLPLWREAADQGRLSAERYEGLWSDVGTPQRLADLESALARVTRSAAP